MRKNEKGQNENEFIKTHIKTSSQDLNNTSNYSNIYLSKLMNQNKDKNEILINESLPNLKNNIQNIFANDDTKEKVFQYLMQKNKDRSNNISKDYKKVLKTPEIKPYKKLEIQEKRIVSPYNNKYYYYKPNITTYDSSKSCIEIRPPNNEKKYYINNMSYRPSISSQRYIYEDEPVNQNEFYKDNNFYQNNNNTFTNLLTNNNVNLNKNKGNKYEHISIYNTYNNTFNNFKVPKKKLNKNCTNQTYDYDNQYNLRDTINKKDKNENTLDKNPYKDYMKYSNLSNFKKKLLDSKKNIIDISDTENNIKEKEKKYNKNTDTPNKNTDTPNNDENLQNKKNNYVKRVKNDRIKVQKNENLYMKKPYKTNNNDSLISNKTNNSFYVHKNFRYKRLMPKKTPKDNFEPNPNIDINENNNNIIYVDNDVQNKNDDNKKNEINTKTYEKRKNYYDIYGHKDIRVNTNNNGQSDEPSSKVNTIKVNIDKKLIKDYYNSPLSQRYNNYFIKNKKINNSTNKKIYEKRETLQRSPKPNYSQNQVDKNTNNNEQVSENAKNTISTDNNINNSNKTNKYVFNDEEEIIEFIKKKYNKRKVDEILNRGDNGMVVDANEPKKEKEKKYLGLMTTEEGKKIKQKNEELSTQIKQLKYENKNYKKELNDIKNKFDDLSKEINDIREKK